MKREFLGALVCANLLVNAQANLGETYQETCKRFGGPGQETKHSGFAWFLPGGFPETFMVVFAYFKADRCTQIAYVFDHPMAEEMIHSLLADNGGESVWMLAKDGYSTPDGRVASIEQDGRAIRFIDKREQSK